MSKLDDILSSDWGGGAPAPNNTTVPNDTGSQAAPNTDTDSKLNSILGADWGKKGNTGGAKQETSPITADTPWSDVFSQGLHNIPKNAAETASGVVTGIGNIASAIRHPEDTLNSLENADWSGIGNKLEHDYLTEEGWKQGIANDPVGRALDVSTVLAGPEELAARAATKAGATGVARGINAARFVTDPAYMATKTAGKALNLSDKLFFDVAGSHAGTGTGGTSLNLLHQAFKTGNMADMKAAWSGVWGTEDPIRAVDGFQQAVRDEGAQQRLDYQNRKIDWGNDKKVLDHNPVYNALQEVDNRFNTSIGTGATAKPTQVSMNTQAVRDALTDAVNNHFNLAAAGNTDLLTPLGFDDLKHNVDAILAGTQKGTESYAAATIVKQAIAKEIKDNAPKYADAMASYQAKQEAINRFKSELSLGGKPDVALRKLLSSLRNNVSSNFLARWNLVQQLANGSNDARRSLYNLAGQANTSMTPRGLFGSLKTGTGGLGALLSGPAAVAHALINPWEGPLIAMQSPKLMGNVAMATGLMARPIAKMPWRPFVYAGHAASPFYMDGSQ